MKEFHDYHTVTYSAISLEYLVTLARYHACPKLEQKAHDVSEDYRISDKQADPGQTSRFAGAELDQHWLLKAFSPLFKCGYAG